MTDEGVANGSGSGNGNGNVFFKFSASMENEKKLRDKLYFDNRKGESGSQSTIGSAGSIRSKNSNESKKRRLSWPPTDCMFLFYFFFVLLFACMCLVCCVRIFFFVCLCDAMF